LLGPPDEVAQTCKGHHKRMKLASTTWPSRCKPFEADTAMLAEAASDGWLGTRADAGKHRGDYRRIIDESRCKMGEVLVVDDSKTIRMVLRKILRELGYEVCEAADGKEALKVMEAEKSTVKLVLADWNMPVMNGMDLLKQLRRDPELSSLIVIMVTTETEVMNMVAALEAGANEYVMKPFTKEILKDKLELVGIHPLAGPR
jgi:two-component system chemotaxis response regulator CheY